MKIAYVSKILYMNKIIFGVPLGKHPYCVRHVSCTPKADTIWRVPN